MISKIGFWQNTARVLTDGRQALETADLSHPRPTHSEKRADLADADALAIVTAYEDLGQGWFWATDAAGCITYLTDQIIPLIAGNSGSPIGSTFTELFVKNHEASAAGRSLPFLFARELKFEKVIVQAAGSSETRLWSVSGVPQFDRQGRFSGFRGNGVDITEQTKSSEHASRLARYDALTGLPNRLRLSEVLEDVLSSADANRPVARS